MEREDSRQKKPRKSFFIYFQRPAAARAGYCGPDALRRAGAQCDCRRSVGAVIGGSYLKPARTRGFRRHAEWILMMMRAQPYILILRAMDEQGAFTKFVCQ
jgi:hypothetical protein